MRWRLVNPCLRNTHGWRKRRLLRCPGMDGSWKTLDALCRFWFLAGNESNLLDLNGADRVTRTPDLRITNALLYQLSYVGTWKGGQYIQNPPFTQYRADF